MRKRREETTLLTISQAAKRAGTSRTTIYAAIERQQLKPVIAEPVVLLDAVDVDAFGAAIQHQGGRPKKRKEERETE